MLLFAGGRNWQNRVLAPRTVGIDVSAVNAFGVEVFRELSLPDTLPPPPSAPPQRSRGDGERPDPDAVAAAGGQRMLTAVSADAGTTLHSGHLVKRSILSRHS